MDQSTARRLARQVSGVATQEARNRGQWGSKTGARGRRSSACAGS